MECAQFFDIIRVEIKNTAGVSYGVTVDRVVEWKMHLIKFSQEDAFFHSKTLFVKSKIICKQLTSLKIIATDMDSVRIFESYTVLFQFRMHQVSGTTMQATATMKDLTSANYLSERTHCYQ